MKLNKIIINLVLITILVATSKGILTKFVELRKSEQVMTELKVNNKDEELKSKNEDYRFWLQIAGTQIDNPVVQSEDNEFYLTKDFNKQDNIAGTPFLDYRNDCLNDKNTIIYAHNMKNGSMFGELKKFKDESFFKQNNQIVIELNGEKSIYEVFSVYINDNSTDYLKVDFFENEYETYLNDALNKSIHKSNTEVNKDDKIITFSTCSYEFKNARLVVHAKLVK